VSAPKTLLPPRIEEMGVTVCNKVEDALADADVVMGLRLQKERQQSGLLPSLREYATEYGINEKRMKLANDDCLIMHPGPVNRGVEMTSSVVDHAQSVIDEQVLNGVAIRMALLYLLSRREAK
jgi:aspartate carbamoyltransferase catalytic subunit